MEDDRENHGEADTGEKKCLQRSWEEIGSKIKEEEGKEDRVERGFFLGRVGIVL